MHGDQGLSRVAVVVMHGVCMHREPEEGALTVVPFLPCVSGHSHQHTVAFVLG